MKFQMISAADVDVIREARKALKRLRKRLAKLDEKRTDALRDTSKDYMKAANDCNRMLDELVALHVFVYATGDMSLEA